MDKLLRFNPRTRDGCEYHKWYVIAYILVSIHAPVMGAKVFDLAFIDEIIVSIHAPVMGAKLSSDASGASTKFQSTHP